MVEGLFDMIMLYMVAPVASIGTMAMIYIFINNGGLFVVETWEKTVSVIEATLLAFLITWLIGKRLDSLFLRKVLPLAFISALLALGIITIKQLKARPKEEEEEEFWRCPKCDSKNFKYHTACWNCSEPRKI